MATLEWHVTRDGGVTLVRLLVTSGTTERVRVRNCLDGPVWPPRRQGIPEEGWDGDEFEGVIDGSDRLVLGYASPAEPTDPPARLTHSEPVEDRPREEEVTARDVIRTLGDPCPPRDVVGTGEPRNSRSPELAGTDDHPDSPEVPSGREPPPVRSGAESDRPAGSSDGTEGGDEPGDVGGSLVPDRAVDAWLGDVRNRLDEVERLADVSSVAGATEAVEAVGGAEDIAALRTQLEEDRERLESLAEESETLAARIESVEVPVEMLQQLA